MVTIFDFQPSQTLDSLRSSPVVFPGPENIGIVAGILLLACIEAEIFVMSHLLSVNGSHL